MKRILAITASALLGASMLASPALSQDGAGVSPDAAVSGEDNRSATTNQPTPGAEIDSSTTAAVDGSVDMDRTMAAIGANSQNAVTISEMSEVTSIQVVPVSSFGGNAANVDQALAGSPTGLPELHAAIEGNTMLMSELQAAGVELDNVVAAQVETDGSLTVYVR